MALSITDLFKPVTADQALDSFLSILEELGMPARSWRAAGVARTILRVVAITYAGFTEVMAAFIRSGFLETAEGDWLRALAYYLFGVEPREATFATGEAQLTNAGGGIWSYAADAFRIINPTTKKAYANTEAFTLNPGDVLLVDFRAVEIGSDSSSGPGTITALETPLESVSVTNPAAFVGLDLETDEEIRKLCKAKLAAISVRGPRGAYEYAVRTAKLGDGSPVNVNRHQVSKSSSTGTVTIYIAAPSGAPTAADIDAVIASVEEHARPDTVTATVLAATEVPVSRSLTIWAKRIDGVSASDIKDFVDLALIEAASTYPIGGIPKPPSLQGYLYADFLAGVCKSAHASIFDVDGTGADVALNAGQVAVLTTTTEVRIVDVS